MAPLLNETRGEGRRGGDNFVCSDVFSVSNSRKRVSLVACKSNQYPLMTIFADQFYPHIS
jgi:hypothetical protein